MKLDTHVHTFHSGRSSIYPLESVVRESYNTPEDVYQLAKARGMDLVTITDHDAISGAMTLADRDDVIVGCEVTGVFPDDGVRVHLNVLGLDESQHGEIQRIRHDVRDLMAYLHREGLFTSLNHVASGVNGPITAPHVAVLLPWVDALEITNGSRLLSQNRTAQCLADAAGKIGIAGSDSHTRRGIAKTWTEVPGAQTRAEFLAGLKAGRARTAGADGSYFTMAEDILRFTGNFYRERVERFGARPIEWQASLWAFGAPVVVPIALVAAYVHFVVEERFNRNLLYDLVAHPARVMKAVPELAA